jgi:hypothetical protein
MLRLQSHHNGRMLQVEAREPGDEGAPFVLATKDGELEITQPLLEWLCTISGPAALHARRRAVDEPPPASAGLARPEVSGR